MIRFNPERARSAPARTRMREETLERAWQIVVRLPAVRRRARQLPRGVAAGLPGRLLPAAAQLLPLGRVARAACFVLAAYVAAVLGDVAATCRSITTTGASRSRDRVVGVGASAWSSCCSSSSRAFADLWLNPITYVMLGLIIVDAALRRKPARADSRSRVVAVPRRGRLARHDVRVAYFAPLLATGGTQRHLQQVLGLLDPQRFEPRVFTLRPGGEVERRAARARACRVTSLDVRGRLSAPATVRAHRCATARGLRAERVDVVHGYQWRPALVGALVGRLGRRPAAAWPASGA